MHSRYRRAVSPNLRVRLVVAATALAGAGAVTGVVLATRQDPPQPTLQCARASAVVIPGIAGRGADVSAAFAAWPRGTVTRLQALANRYPRDPVVQFNYGLALECRGYLGDAQQVLERTKRVGRDTQYEIDADQLLHPAFFQGGYPVFEPSTSDALLVRGSLLQRQGHQHSAERLYAKAAQLHPNDPEAQVAAAVGRFDMDNPSAAFSHLGPLAKRFPQSQVVRYYLGLLLVWIGQRDEAVAEFKQAVALGPGTTLGKQVAQLLARIERGGSGAPQR
jgi:tetratricopeptide (TPR) repeat protein